MRGVSGMRQTIQPWRLSLLLSGILGFVQVNLDMTDSMGPGKLVRHMQNLSYTYDEYLICIGLGPIISSVICKNLSYSGLSYPSSPVLVILLWIQSMHCSRPLNHENSPILSFHTIPFCHVLEPVQCNPATEFSCLDGKSCVDLRRRCDQRNDCEDGSDEKNCGMLSTFVILHLIYIFHLHLGCTYGPVIFHITHYIKWYLKR